MDTLNSQLRNAVMAGIFFVALAATILCIEAFNIVSTQSSNTFVISFWILLYALAWTALVINGRGFVYTAKKFDKALLSFVPNFFAFVAALQGVALIIGIIAPNGSPAFVFVGINSFVYICTMALFGLSTMTLVHEFKALAPLCALVGFLWGMYFVVMIFVAVGESPISGNTLAFGYVPVLEIVWVIPATILLYRAQKMVV